MKFEKSKFERIRPRLSDLPPARCHNQVKGVGSTLKCDHFERVLTLKNVILFSTHKNGQYKETFKSETFLLTKSTVATTRTTTTARRVLTAEGFWINWAFTSNTHTISLSLCFLNVHKKYPTHSQTQSACVCEREREREWEMVCEWERERRLEYQKRLS